MEQRWYTYKKTPEYQLKVQEAGGFIFLHMEVEVWNKGVLSELRELSPEVLTHFRELGHDVIFTTSIHKKSLKFWRLIRPWYTLQELGSGGQGWIGAWLTEEET